MQISTSMAPIHMCHCLITTDLIISLSAAISQRSMIRYMLMDMDTTFIQISMAIISIQSVTKRYKRNKKLMLSKWLSFQLGLWFVWQLWLICFVIRVDKILKTRLRKDKICIRLMRCNLSNKIKKSEIRKIWQILDHHLARLLNLSKIKACILSHYKFEFH